MAKTRRNVAQWCTSHRNGRCVNYKCHLLPVCASSSILSLSPRHRPRNTGLNGNRWKRTSGRDASTICPRERRKASRSHAATIRPPHAKEKFRLMNSTAELRVFVGEGGERERPYETRLSIHRGEDWATTRFPKNSNSKLRMRIGNNCLLSSWLLLLDLLDFWWWRILAELFFLCNVRY